VNLLLDTHASISWENLDPRLGVSASAVIADPADVVFVSAASVWEIAVKQAVGRLTFFVLLLWESKGAVLRLWPYQGSTPNRRHDCRRFTRIRSTAC
jgi:hypothetical protein